MTPQTIELAAGRRTGNCGLTFIPEKFPFIFPIIGNLNAEMGSTATASATTHSYLFDFACASPRRSYFERVLESNLPSRVKFAGEKAGAALLIECGPWSINTLLNATSNTSTNCCRKRPMKIGEQYFCASLPTQKKRLVSTVVAEFLFIVEGFWNKDNFCDACHKRKYGSLPMLSLLNGGQQRFHGRRRLWRPQSLKPNRQLCKSGGYAPSAGWCGYFILLGTTGL